MASVIADIAAVGFGGALGAIARYGVGNLRFFDNEKYFYTMIANITGCIIIGVLWTLFRHFGEARMWYLFAVTGCLGGFTTYSTFSLDAVTQWNGGHVDIALLYIAATLICGLGGCALGMWGTSKIINLI